MDTSYDIFKQILKYEIGLDADSVGEATIKKFLGQRMRACKLENIEEYCQLLSNNDTELAALLETAVIPETWFFRDARPFNVILNSLQKNAQTFQNRPCTILSIPCSTGEEPYSIAMHLLQAGIPARNFKIKAVDISQRALDIAQQGYYGKNSFRGQIYQPYLSQYFTPQYDQYSIQDKVRQCVTFHRVNLLDNRTLPYDQYFDFVLCRNLLIYFDISSKLEAFKNIHRMLKDDGMLFIGHAEFGAVPRDLFTNIGAELAFGLTKFLPGTSIPIKPAVHTLNNTPEPPPYFIPEKAIIKTKPAFSDFIPLPVQPIVNPDHVITHVNKSNLLEQAQLFADQGNLQNAEECCLRYMEEHGENCDSLFLLALINGSSGQHKMAEKLYRKALYLDPKHYQSLIHLSLLLERSGDHKTANLLRQRAERAIKK